MKILKNISLFLILGLFISLSFQSCDKDVEGCMASDAENFNPDANIDNGLCVFARDKFLGTFAGILACPLPLEASEEFTITFTEGLANNSEVEITFQNLDTPVPVLSGTVDGDKVIIADTETTIALDPNLPDVKTAITFSGTAILDASGENLSGELKILITILGQ